MPEAQSQVVHVINEEHVSEEVLVTQIDTVHSEHIGSVLSDTQDHVNQMNILSNVLLRESDPLICGQEEKSSFVRVSHDEDDSALDFTSETILPQNDCRNQVKNDLPRDLQKLHRPLSRTRSEKLISKRRQWNITS